MRKWIRALNDLLATRTPQLSHGVALDISVGDVSPRRLDYEREEARQLRFVRDAKRQGFLRSRVLYPVEQRAQHRKAVTIARKMRARRGGQQ